MDGAPRFDGFSDVDATGAPERYAGYLAELRRIDAVREWKARSIGLLEPRPGMVLLDAGCGTGEDARELARRVAPGGRAIGIDASTAMIAEARRRGHGDGCDFRRGDLLELELPDASVHGCRAERVLQHLDAPGRAVRELARVVRPGGRVVVAEPDWGTLVLDAGDPAVADEVAAAAGRAIRSPGVGRTLPRLLAEAGLAEVGVTARTLLLTDAGAARIVLGLDAAAARAVGEGRLSPAAVARWHEDVAAGPGRDAVVAAMTAVMAWGRRPVGRR